jgi:uncharacterized protein (TIGR04255 family)
MSRTLPDFGNPPVGEVVLSIQFEPLMSLTAAQLGYVWSLFKDEFPKASQKTPIDSVIETFAERSSQIGKGFSFTLVNDGLVPRLWFKNESETDLIQVQRDRFLRNWIRQDEDYPRYEHVRKGFEDTFTKFCEFLREERLGEIQPTQAEVTYINHIVADSGNPWDVGKVLNCFDSSNVVNGSLALESTRAELRYVIVDSSGNNAGRLYVNAFPTLKRSDMSEMIRMDLTARGIIGEPPHSTKNVFDFFDLGRETIVTTFAHLTTVELHELWGRTL